MPFNDLHAVFIFKMNTGDFIKCHAVPESDKIAFCSLPARQPCNTICQRRSVVRPGLPLLSGIIPLFGFPLRGRLSRPLNVSFSSYEKTLEPLWSQGF